MSSMFSSLFARDPVKDFPFELLQKIGQKAECEVFALNKGKRKGADETVSIFTADAKSGATSVDITLAKSCAKRLKTLRHPNVLTFIDSLETDSLVSIVTEQVSPLSEYLESLADLSGEKRELIISWGLYQISNAVKFLSQDAKLINNNLRGSSVYVNKCGEWKLFGFEYLTPQQGATAVPVKPYALEKYNAPECKNGNVNAEAPWALDSWGLGCLIWEVFNGPLTTGGIAQLKAPKAIPKTLHGAYAKLLAPNATQRLTPEQFIEACRKPNGFMRNKFVDCLLFLEEFHLKEAREKSTFLSQFQDQLDLLPEGVQKYKILPLLINAYEYGNAGSAVLSPLLKIGKMLSEVEYQQQIVPCVVKFFNSTDRATRVRLLQQIESFVEHLQPSIVNDKIFAPLSSGFMDTNPAVRESTVKAIVFLAPKLNYNNLNIELMKHFARLQSKDDQSGIRTNTTICLGKIAGCIHPQHRQKILISAFSRSLKDPFPPSRIAGILALAATQQFYPLSEVSNRILPALCTLTMDPEKQVRDQAFKAVKGFVEKLEKASENPELIAEMESQVNAGGVGAGVSESVPQWANWALSALSSKFYKSASPAPNTVASAQKATTGSTPADGKPPAGNKAVSAERSAPTVHGEKDTDGWDEDQNDLDWGEMEESTQQSAGTKKQEAAATATSAYDGWDDEEPWESMEDKSTPTQSMGKATTTSRESGPKKEADDESGWNENSGWGESETVSDHSHSASKADERRQKAEERRLEMEKRRLAKQAGPMKLGAKKMGDPPF